jgi:amino acid transporter
MTTVKPAQHSNRTIGLLGEKSLGVGAIVGGGILALAGVAFTAAGLSVILAFALNGVMCSVAAGEEPNCYGFSLSSSYFR